MKSVWTGKTCGVVGIVTASHFGKPSRRRELQLRALQKTEPFAVFALSDSGARSALKGMGKS